MSKIKLIIFDWDDVFTLGSKEGYFKCYHETLEELGVKLNPEEEKKRILAKWSQPHREELRELLKEKPELLNHACNIYEKKLFGNAFIDCLSLVPGAIELLHRLSKKYILTVATGLNSTIMKERIIPKFNVPNVFSQIISTYDIENPKNHKPSPYIANKILKHHVVLSDEALLVGDAKNDILMAQSANIVPVVVLTGHLNKKEAKELNVKYIIKSVIQIEKVLDEINQGNPEKNKI